MGGNSSTYKQNAERSANLDTEPTLDLCLLSNKLNFLVLGKTGTGKSACCNAIAGVPDNKPVFVSYNSSSSVTKTVCIYQIKRWGKEIKVTDTPGLKNTDFDDIEDARFAKKNMINAMKICPEGFHAICIVLSYQDHFFGDDEKVIELITEIFGEEMFQFTVLIFTHGDVFDQNNGIKNVSESQKLFKSWCEKQTRNLKNLLEKCNFRAVLFHNSSKYEVERDGEMIELKRQTERIIQKGKLYTNVQFQRNKIRRDRILLNTFLDDLKKNINESLMALKKELVLITSQEKKIIERVDAVLSNRTSNMPDLQKLMNELDDFKLKLKWRNKDLYTEFQREIDTKFFLSLQALSDDLKKVTKPEKHKEDLRYRAMALKNYIIEEDYGTGKLCDEMEQLNYFLSEINVYDTKGEGAFTERR